MRRPELRVLMRPTKARWIPRLVAIFLLLAAALVVGGVSVEAALGHTETATESSEHDEGGEGHEETGESGLEGATLVGIRLESPLFIGGLAAASVLLALGIWVRPGRATATATILFSIAAGVFDVSEIQNQAAEGSAGLLAVAVVIVLLRVLTIVGSVIVIRDRVRQLHAAAA